MSLHVGSGNLFSNSEVKENEEGIREIASLTLSSPELFDLLIQTPLFIGFFKYWISPKVHPLI